VKEYVKMYCFCVHALTRCDSVSRVCGIEKMGFQQIIKKRKAMKDCSKAFSLPMQSQDMETNGDSAV